MTNRVTRLYALAATIAVFSVIWAILAARPWQAAASAEDPRLAQLAAREQRLRERAVVVQRIVDRRWAAYDARLTERRRHNATVRREAQRVAAQVASAPPVQVVTLPPVTQTRSS